MDSCPGDQELLGLLGEQLDAADESRIVSHVQVCERCQERLDDLTRADEPSPSWISPPAPPSPSWVFSSPNTSRNEVDPVGAILRCSAVARSRPGHGTRPDRPAARRERYGAGR